MANHTSPVLHRDDPDKDPLSGHVKVTKQDWLNIARDVLVTDGIGQLKILGLANRMGVSRSSFYWYFKDRADLQSALLDEWETRNTAQIVVHCRMPSSSPTETVCNFFRCFVVAATFDRRLDFAIREWARRDVSLRARVDHADQSRISALTTAFERHGFAPEDADARARILYFMQLGYHALEIREDKDTRMSRLAPYIRGFTGQEPDPDALAAFLADVERLGLK
jgi:AcrR family transcriptional regulator